MAGPCQRFRLEVLASVALFKAIQNGKVKLVLSLDAAHHNNLRKSGQRLGPTGTILVELVKSPRPGPLNSAYVTHSPAMQELQPVPKILRCLGWAFLVLGLWTYIFYWSFRAAPVWTVSIGLAAAVILVITVILLQFRRRSSLKLVVIFIPILIAVACIPVRTVFESRHLIRTLSDVGISEFQVLPHGNWRWAGSVIRNTFDTELVSVEMDLTQLDQSKLGQIPRDRVRFVSIYVQEPGIRLEQPVVDWIEGCPLKPFLSIHLVEPEPDELEIVGSLANDTMMELQSDVLRYENLDFPELWHMHLKNSRVDPAFGNSAELPKLKTLLLYNCHVVDGASLKRFSPQVHMKFFNSQITRNASALFETSSPNLNITRLSFPEDLSPLKVDATLPAENTIMFQYCQFSDQCLLDIVRARRSRKLLMTDCSPLEPSTVEELLGMPCIEELILGGSWIKIQHLRRLGSRKTPIKIGLERLTIDVEELVRLKADLPAHVKLTYARTQEP